MVMTALVCSQQNMLAKKVNEGTWALQSCCWSQTITFRGKRTKSALDQMLDAGLLSELLLWLWTSLAAFRLAEMYKSLWRWMNRQLLAGCPEPLCELPFNWRAPVRFAFFSSPTHAHCDQVVWNIKSEVTSSLKKRFKSYGLCCCLFACVATFTIGIGELKLRELCYLWGEVMRPTVCSDQVPTQHAASLAIHCGNTVHIYSGTYIWAVPCFGCEPLSPC